MSLPDDWEVQIQDMPELEPAVKLALAVEYAYGGSTFEQFVAHVRELNDSIALDMDFAQMHAWLHCLSWLVHRLDLYVDTVEERAPVYMAISEIASLAIALHRGYREDVENAELFSRLGL